jgi:hypothetical protein
MNVQAGLLALVHSETPFERPERRLNPTLWLGISQETVFARLFCRS